MDKEALKIKIEEAIEKTSAKIKELREMAAPVGPDNAIGRVSRMDAINNKSIVEASLANQEKKLNGLQYALQNLSNEAFGKCASCGQWIEERRIILIPESRFCVNCQKK
jgi:DnaK suppressor protein